MTAQPSIHDCWNKIGVQGDLSCPELVQHIHCRNCPVYSAAATALLDSDVPDEYVDERTTYFLQKKQDDRQNSRSLTIFRIGAEWLALPTDALVEVADLRPVHTLPHRNNGVVLGLVNVRGELLICVSLGRLLGLDPVRPKPDRQHDPLQAVYRRLLVIQGEGGRLVFPVDEMHGVQRFPQRELQELPETVAKATAMYATAILPWRDRALGCLDAQLVLHTLNRSLA
jgi:chemotaxis-related protein WspD